MNADDIRRIVADSVALKERFFAGSAPLVIEVGARMARSLLAGGRVLAFGNGGSASDAQHFVAELVGRFERERAGLSAIALATDPSVVTAVSNDMGFAAVFRRQVEAHGRPGDVALGISTSGRSRWKRPTSSATKCWASAADPPLPNASTRPPASRHSAMREPTSSRRGAFASKKRSFRLTLSATILRMSSAFIGAGPLCARPCAPPKDA